MKEDADPLDEMYMDSSPFDRKEMSQSLTQYLGIDPDNGTPVIKPPFHGLDDKQKLIAYLVYARAAHELGEISESEIPQNITTIAQTIGVPEPDADQLAVDLELVEGKNNPHGPYFIRPSRIDEAIGSF